nr:MAG TPA: hypothetical protein [Caudoviricetes sp.]
MFYLFYLHAVTSRQPLTIHQNSRCQHHRYQPQTALPSASLQWIWIMQLTGQLLITH